MELHLLNSRCAAGLASFTQGVNTIQLSPPADTVIKLPGRTESQMTPHPPQTAATLRTSVTLALVLAFLFPAFDVPTGLAQEGTAITPTIGVGSLGTTVIADGNTIKITGGTRPGDGTNLFHSFDQFSVGHPDTAQFLNTTPSLSTYNILGRVTGGTPSSIFGTIDTMSYPGANLFLMNPAGIVFGPNATLHVGGSVAFTTVDYLRLADNARFTAIPGPTDALLSTASITAFGFLGSTPGPITVQGGRLRVDPGQTLALIGGNITVDSGAHENGLAQPGQLTSPGGQIHLASVASPGEILAGALDQTANINGQSFGALGTIQILQQSNIDTSGEDGGTILIRGGRLVVDDSRISANTKTVGLDMGLEARPSETGIDIQVAQEAIIDNGSIIETNAIGPVVPDRGSGGVRITADHIEISGGPKIFAILETNPETIPFAGIRSNVEPKSTAARSGDISLDATSIRIKDVGQIETRTADSTGNAGHITLEASGDIDINMAIVSSVSENSSGHAGNLTFSSRQGNVSLTDTAVTSQTINSSGNTGNIAIHAPHGDIVLADQSGVFNTVEGSGKLGGIQITANNLQLLSESRIEGDNFTTPITGNISIVLENRLSLSGGSVIETGALGSANAANLIIRASDILITGKDSHLFTGTISSGDGGRLHLFTDNLQLEDGGTLSSKSFIGSDGEIPSGSGGVISIQGLRSSGTSVTIDGPGSGILTNSEGTDPGGAINLSARSLTIQNGGIISASTSGTVPRATGGSIIVNATDHVTMTSGASITASSTSPGNANAGDISINAGQNLEMRDSSIKTESEKASGGNIDIQAVDRVRLVNSPISTSVPNGTGDGGNITIDPNVIVLQNSDITAKAVQGAGGNITLTTPLFLRDSSSQVDASSQFGVNGTVTIQSPTSNVSGSLGPLASKPSQAQALLTQRCAALVNGQASSFVVAGREQLPADPGGWLASPLAFAALGENLDADNAVASISTVMAIAADNTSTVSLRRLTPARFLMANFAESEATGCRS